MRNDLEKLRQMTEKLPDVPGLSQIIECETATEAWYKVEAGQKIYGKMLHNNGGGAAVISQIQKGTRIKRHSHPKPIREWLIVISGSLKAFNGKLEGKIIKAGESICFESEQSHRLEALKNTVLYAITVPADKGYPDGR